MTYELLQVGESWKQTVMDLADDYLGPGTSAGFATTGDAEDSLASVAAILGLTNVSSGEPRLQSRSKINALLDAANARAVIQGVLGSKARLLIDGWNRPDRIVTTGGLVNRVTDLVSGVAFEEAVSGPTLTNDGRVLQGDGVAACLTATDMSWAPATGFSCFGVVRCDLDPATDTVSHTVLSFGNNLSTGFCIQRRPTGGINRLGALIGTGSGNVSSTFASPNCIVDGGAWWWVDVGAESADVYVNGLFVNTMVATPAFTLNRARLLASPNPSANQFANLGLALAGVCDTADASERDTIWPILAEIAGQVEAS